MEAWPFTLYLHEILGKEIQVSSIDAKFNLDIFHLLKVIDRLLLKRVTYAFELEA